MLGFLIQNKGRINMKVKDLLDRINNDYCSLNFSIHYSDTNDGKYDEIIVDTDFDQAVIDLFGEREICEEDAVWFTDGVLNLYIQ
jgi:hypothetical protein